MLVKKVSPQWQPSENPDLEVGEIIDITDPRTLIINGEVVAVDDDGKELSAYDIYGEITEDEFSQFKAWRELEQAQQMKARLEKEQEELKAKLTPEVKEEVVVEAPKPRAKVNIGANWTALKKMGTDLGLYRVGMTKEALVDAINNHTG